MGFFSSLFNRKSKQEQELDAIFEKIFNILNNDDLQNNILPDMLKKELDPAPLNTLPDAAGEFGRDPENPIWSVRGSNLSFKAGDTIAKKNGTVANDIS